jgi:hypothetical protein
MINYRRKVKRTRVKVPVSIVCDICHKTFDYENDIFEVQEFHHIRFTGGYGSVFGDESEVECDICQHCLKKLVGEYCRYE